MITVIYHFLMLYVTQYHVCGLNYIQIPEGLGYKHSPLWIYALLCGELYFVEPNERQPFLVDLLTDSSMV